MVLNWMTVVSSLFGKLLVMTIISFRKGVWGYLTSRNVAAGGLSSGCTREPHWGKLRMHTDA